MTKASSAQLQLFLLFWGVVVLPSPGVCESRPPVRLAIISGESEHKPSDFFIAQLEVGLSGLRGIGLVERAEIERILAEQHLVWGGLTETALPHSLQLGQLLSADVLVFVEAIQETSPTVYRLRMMESHTGIILGEAFVPAAVEDEDVSLAVQSVKQGAAKQAIAFDQRHFVGILNVKSEEPGGTLDETADTLRIFLEADLGATPEIVLLDREHLQALQDETQLTGLALRMKPSASLVDVGLRSSGDPGRLQIKVLLRQLEGGMQQISFLSPKGDLASMRAQLRDQLQQLIQGKASSAGEITAAQEARVFLNRIPLLISNGEYKRALHHAEAAYALDPSQSARYWVVRSWYFLASEAFEHRSDQLRPGADETSATFSALIRAYTAHYDLTRHHINRYEAGQERDLSIPNPFESPSDVEPPTRLTGLGRPGARPSGGSGNLDQLLSILVHAGKHEATRLYDKLRDLRFEINDVQQNFYARYYGQTEELQQPYWEAWRQRQQLIQAYYPQQPSRHAEFLQQVIEAFLAHPQGEQTARIRGLWEIAVAKPFRLLSDQERGRWQSLAKHEDPAIRIIARHVLMDEDRGKASRDIMTTFYDEFSYKDSRRRLTDATVWPELLRAPVHVLALTDRPSMLEHVGPLVKEILAHEDLDQLLGWRDIFWPYVNGLDLEQRTEEANRVVAQAAALFDRAAVKDFTPKQKRFRSELELHQVRADVKSQMDPSWMAYFSYTDDPSFLGWDPALEAPRPDRTPPQPATPMTTSGQRPPAPPAETARAQDPVWAQVRIERIGSYRGLFSVKHAAWEYLDLRRGDPTDLLRRAPNVIIDGATLFAIHPTNADGEDQKVALYEYQPLGSEATNRKLGSMPQGVYDPQHAPLTGLAVGPDHIFVGTTAGLIVFPRTGGSPPVVFTEQNGLPSNSITALTYYRGTVYLGIGPAEDAGLVPGVGAGEKSGLVAFDPSSGTYQSIASTAVLEPRHGLDGGNSFKITSILADEKRECLWLALAGNPERNGIWKHDLATRRLEQSVSEAWSVQRMMLQDDALVYAMYNSGIVRYDPNRKKKTWLSGYVTSTATGLSTPTAPKGCNGEPLYGHPATLLWPVAVVGQDLLTLSRGGVGLLWHRQGGPASLGKQLDSSGDQKERIRFLTQNEHGIWILTEPGNVYLLKRLEPGTASL